MSHIDTLNESRLSISRDILITIKFKRIVVFPPLEPFSSSKVTREVSFFICRRRSIRANAASRPPAAMHISSAKDFSFVFMWVVFVAWDQPEF